MSLEPIQFFLPGPCYVREDVRVALTASVVGHRSAEFRALYARLAERLPEVLATSGEVYIATGSSTLVMECAVVSTVAERVLNLTCGSFSERWHAISRSVGKEADRLAVPWGRTNDPDELRAALRLRRYDAVTLVHNETSTGVINPLAELARVVREESDALILADTVSSLGGAPVLTDAWGLDVVVAGVQKALAAPPGLVLVTLSDRAATRAEGVPRRGFYTDLLRYRDQHRQTGSTITTPAVPLVYALERQINHVLAEGLEERWRRHRELFEETSRWAELHDFTYASAADGRSPTVSCLLPPAEVSAPRLVRELAARGFVVGGGYGEWKESTFRIGHMGEVRPRDLQILLRTIVEIVRGEPGCPAF